MHRSTTWPGTRFVTLVNIAVPRSLSASCTVALLTWLVALSLCATKAARDEVTTRIEIRMNASRQRG